MLSSKLIARFIHIQKPYLASEKSLLGTLRKKTGYTFANCKKALEMHNNDLNKAEVWLKQQAQALGWAKATKLEGRQTSQGLIAVTVNEKNAAIVEVNCETDFVAKNQEFHKVVEEVASSCLAFVEKQPQSQARLTKVCLDGDQLKDLPARDGKSLADHLALMIGSVGENASLKRAMCLKAQPDIHLMGYAHPSGSNGSILLGKIGGVIALKQSESKDVDIENVGKGLCQHVVGMNPKKIGTPSDKPCDDRDDETCLIHQEYLLDDSVTVKQVLEENEIEVIDFKRFECGEDSIKNVDQPLEFVETCQ